MGFYKVILPTGEGFEFVLLPTTGETAPDEVTAQTSRLFSKDSKGLDFVPGAYYELWYRVAADNYNNPPGDWNVAEPQQVLASDGETWDSVLERGPVSGKLATIGKFIITAPDPVQSGETVVLAVFGKDNQLKPATDAQSKAYLSALGVSAPASTADTTPVAPNDHSLAATEGAPLAYTLGAFTDPATGNPVASHQLIGRPAGMTFDMVTRSGTTGTAVAGTYSLTYMGTGGDGKSNQITISLIIYAKPVSVHVDEVYVNPLPAYQQLGFLVRGNFGSYTGQWKVESLTAKGGTVTAAWTGTQLRPLVSEGGPFAIPAPYTGSAPYGGLASGAMSGWYRTTLTLLNSGLSDIVTDFNYADGVQKVYPISLPNILLNKPAKQSSTRTDEAGTYGPELAVDGDPATWCHTLGDAGAGNDCWQADARQGGIAANIASVFVQRRRIAGETPSQVVDLKARLFGTYLITGTNLPDPVAGDIDAIINLPGVKYVLIKQTDLDENGDYTASWDGGSYTHVRMQRADKSPINFGEIGARGSYAFVNHAPVVATIPPQTTVMGQTASLDLATYVTDADGNPLTYTIHTDSYDGTGALPAGVTVAGSVITCTVANQASAISLTFYIKVDDKQGGITQFQLPWTFTPATASVIANQVQTLAYRFIAGGTPGNSKDQLIITMRDSFPVETTGASSLTLNSLLRVAGTAEVFSYAGFPRNSSDGQRTVTYPGGKAGGGDVGGKSWTFSVRQGSASGSAQSTWTAIISITFAVPAASTDGFVTIYQAPVAGTTTGTDNANLITTETYTF